MKEKRSAAELALTIVRAYPREAANHYKSLSSLNLAWNRIRGDLA